LRTPLDGQRFFCSWSGGKDSCLSLYKAVQAGGIPAALITMMTEGGERFPVSRAEDGRHPRPGRRAGDPVVTRSASWGTYEQVFREAVREFADRASQPACLATSTWTNTWNGA
jgi:diphthamide synthase (EF-2-diphthine--ammonia ligase)